MDQKRSAFDWIQEVVALATMVGTVAVHWDELPAQVPKHFGRSGNPDGWGDKNGMLVLPVMTIGLYVLFTVSSRYRRLINIPMAVDREAPEVRRILQSMTITLKAYQK